MKHVRGMAALVLAMVAGFATSNCAGPTSEAPPPATAAAAPQSTASPAPGAVAAPAESPPTATSSSAPPGGPRVGADRDAHGCIGSAGYRWCQRENQCVRPWELAARQHIARDQPTVDGYCNASP